MNFDEFKKYTTARIGLGHAGAALPTAAWLKFALDHARAQDAVKTPWQLSATTIAGLNREILETNVVDRQRYLARPDLGRILNDVSVRKLMHGGPLSNDSIVLMASNGLSSQAMHLHLERFLIKLLAHCENIGLHIACDRIFLVPNARVGLIDHVGELLRPTIGIMLIGERPGLSAVDSMAAYLTYKPQHGRTDADRNCISNIRPPHGLSYEMAATKLMFLITESMRRKLSGVFLKDESNSSFNVQG